MAEAADSSETFYLSTTVQGATSLKINRHLSSFCVNNMYFISKNNATLKDEFFSQEQYMMENV
jgi:hypothetical protein